MEAIRQHGFEVIAGWINTGLRAALVAAGEILSGGPPLFALRRSRDLEMQLARIHAATPFDVIQIEHFELARYARLIGGSSKTIRSIVLPDVLSVAYARIAVIERSLFWKIWRKYNAFRFHAFERRLLPEYDVCITVSTNDRATISPCTEPAKIQVLPNGVDFKAKRFLEDTNAGPPSLLFVGLLLYPPNADAARWMIETILPRIREHVPDCRLYIVGDGAPIDLLELVHSHEPSVQLAGRVDELSPYYATCEIAVVPLRAGGGTRLKILEAMAFGRAVVSTSVGCEGLSVTDGEHLLLADTTEDFASAVVSLLRNPAERERLRRNARRLVEQYYDWNDSARAHVQIYEDLIREIKDNRPDAR